MYPYPYCLSFRFLDFRGAYITNKRLGLTELFEKTLRDIQQPKKQRGRKIISEGISHDGEGALHFGSDAALRDAEDFGNFGIGLSVEAAEFEDLAGDLRHGAHLALYDCAYLVGEEPLRIAGPEGTDARRDTAGMEAMDVLLLREMERLSVQPVQAVVADGGCDVGRQICLGSNPLPVFPEGGEALHHDVFRYGSVTHISPRDYHKPRVILRIYLLKLRMSDTPPP